MPILYNGIQIKTVKMQNAVLYLSEVRLDFLFCISALFTVILRGRKMHQKHFSFWQKKKIKIEKILENAAILEM